MKCMHNVGIINCYSITRENTDVHSTNWRKILIMVVQELEKLILY